MVRPGPGLARLGPGLACIVSLVLVSWVRCPGFVWKRIINPHAWAREYPYDDEEEKRTPGVGDGSLTRREKKEKIEAPQWEPIPERLVMSPKRLHISIISYP